MMVPVDALKRLRPHCQETSRLPNRHAALHEPGGGGVPKRMRDHFLDAGSLAGGREALLNVLNRRPVDVQHVAQIGAAPPSTLQVGQKPRRNANLATTLLCACTTSNIEVDQTRFKVNLWPSERQDRFLPPARIEAQ